MDGGILAQIFIDKICGWSYTAIKEIPPVQAVSKNKRRDYP